jgi:hypothetical protein
MCIETLQYKNSVPLKTISFYVYAVLGSDAEWTRG